MDLRVVVFIAGLGISTKVTPNVHTLNDALVS